MLRLTSNGRITREVAVRTTHSGKTVATISVGSDRRDRDAQPVYIDLIVWQAQATAAPSTSSRARRTASPDASNRANTPPAPATWSSRAFVDT